MLAFRVDMERDFSSFHDWFQAIEEKIKEIIDILKIKDEVNKFEMMAHQAPVDSPPQ